MREIDEGLKEIVVIIGSSVAILTILIVLGWIVTRDARKEQIERWNNGVCECGGRYEFTQALPRRGFATYDTVYIYQCDECGRVIEVDSDIVE